MMKKVQIDSSPVSDNVRDVLMRFVQTARKQGYDDAYIETVIQRIIATDATQLKKLLHPEISQPASSQAPS